MNAGAMPQGRTPEEGGRCRAHDPDAEAWRAHGDDEARFSPPPQSDKQRLPAEGETLLLAALLCLLWTQDADRELLAALAYILL